MDNSLKDKVLEATDIVEVVGERVALTRKGKDYHGLCPFHPDKNPSLSVSSAKQIFKCWACGAGGDVIRFVQLRDRVEFREALHTLAKRAGIESLGQRSSPRESGQREALYAAMSWAADAFRRNLAGRGGAGAAEYARSRGIEPRTIETHGIGFAPEAWDTLVQAAAKARLPRDLLVSAGLIGISEKGKAYDRFRNRLIFPIFDGPGRPIAFGGRSLGDDPAKYLNSPETPLFSKSRVLYGLNLARKTIESASQAIIVEGYLDAVLLHQAGFQNAVATLGTALTDQHVKLLRPLARTLVLCFDGDEAGLKAADRAVEIALRNRIEVRIAELPDGLDPADCVLQRGEAGFRSALLSAIPALEFKWLLAEKAISAGENRRDAVEGFLQFVARVAGSGGVDPIEQGLLVSRLSGMLGLPTEAVYKTLGMVKAARRPADPSASGDATSEYELSIRGIPSAIVSAMEELFGWLVADSACCRLIDDHLVRTAALCNPWQRAQALIADLVDRLGDFSEADVIEACRDAAMAEMLGRAKSRIQDDLPAADGFKAAYERLISELEVHDMATLRGRLRGADPGSKSGEDAFRAFMDKARRQSGTLAAERRVDLGFVAAQATLRGGRA